MSDDAEAALYQLISLLLTRIQFGFGVRDSVPAAGATVFQLLSDDCCDGALVNGGAPFEEFEEATEGQPARTWSLDRPTVKALATDNALFL